MNEPMKVHMVSLGCPKNRVDSEVILGEMVGSGYQTVASPEGADVIVVNTCGFIDAAKEESVDTILEMAEHKKGSCSKLVVTGCLSQRYAPQLAKEIPEVDHFLGTGNFNGIVQALESGELTPVVEEPSGRRILPIVQEHPRLKGANKLVPFRHEVDAGERSIYIPDPDFPLTAQSPRVATQAIQSQYVKVSEGCSNTCSFCIIPKLRGPQRSRTIADVVQEAERLVGLGAVELNLIAQDLCAFGKDLAPRQNLAQLLRALDKVGAQASAPVWIRCLYAYPRGLTREVMEVIGSGQSILPYLDMPLQHISDSMLRRMRRGKGGESTKELLRRLRREVPNLTLRTTFIAGMPGETEDDFKELCDFVEELRFERMGVFVYSPEEDTPAGEMPGQVPEEIARERAAALMEIQKQISLEQQEALVGTTVKVLVEGVSEETELLLQGRHQGQAPDIDGVTYINSGEASPGDVVDVKIEQAMDYDLVGGILP
jgi:ribosomal protein S12 methylthiotransferase